MRTLSGSLLLTFRELWAMRITQGVLVIATIAWLLLSFAMNLEVVEGSIAALRIFGFETNPVNSSFDQETQEVIRTAVSLDNFMLAINEFVFGATYFLGTLLGLFATMPLIGGFLEQGRIDLLVSKPISRARLLTGHLTGVWLTVLALVTYLVGGVWLSLSLKTGVWDASPLVSIPIIVVMFGVMYSVIMTITVITRTSGLALVIAYGLIFLSAILAAHEQIEPVLNPVAASIFIGFYHALPNFIEVVAIQAQLVSGETVKSWYPLISSLLFGVTTYGFGYFWFSKRDF